MLAAMRLVVADCSVDYSGRLDTHLPRATRLIMVKADGTVAVHADGSRVQPLNWMGSPNQLIEDEDRWIVTNGKGEQLTIELYQVHYETEIEMGDDPGLQKDGVETELQRLIAERVEVLGSGMELIRREYPTPVGPVDLLCRDDSGTVAVEIKRRGEIGGVEQLTRYLEFLSRDERLAPVRGLLVAQLIKPQARLLAEDRGIACVELDYDELREIDSPILKLF
jgi:RecB family endonuclease NucS